MDDLITQLNQVLSTMNTISVVELENMNKFMDCARRIRLVAEILNSANVPEPEQKPETEKSEVVTDG